MKLSAPYLDTHPQLVLWSISGRLAAIRLTDSQSRISASWTVLLDNVQVIMGLPFNVTDEGQGFVVYIGDLQLLEHTKLSPMLYVGLGVTNFPEDSGNFYIEDYISARIPLNDYNISCDQISCSVRLSSGKTYVTLLLQSEKSQALVLSLQDRSLDFDRSWLRVKAEVNEEVYGGGEQYSYFNLRHRDHTGENVFPMWVREQGKSGCHKQS
ncbi:hypothetical protein Btru_067055 [Bulinus truncatus]|nr:hypothetical protein Btru_067055 [Bulinus truncatus]